MADRSISGPDRRVLGSIVGFWCDPAGSAESAGGAAVNGNENGGIRK